MDIETVDRAPVRYAYLRHIGPYPEIGSTFGRMAALAGPAGMLGGPDALFIGVYHDDPMTNPPGTLRSDAGVTLADGVPVPDGLEEGALGGGRHAKDIHKGSYAKMGDGWMALYESIHRAGLKPRPAPPFEIYVSDMETTPEDELITELYVPIA